MALKMKYRSLGLAVLMTSALLALAGCSAGQVKGDSFKSSYAPVNHTGATKSVNYCNAGAQVVRNSRREDAYRKMYMDCNGRYEIIREESLSKPIAVCMATQRIIFQCVQ